MLNQLILERHSLNFVGREERIFSDDDVLVSKANAVGVSVFTTRRSLQTREFCISDVFVFDVREIFGTFLQLRQLFF